MGPGARPSWDATRAAERIIGRSNLVGIRYFDRARLASRTVGRVVIRDSVGGSVQGYGTGFMVTDRLLLTNNHVLGSPEAAVSSQVEFNYEDDLFGQTMPPSLFNLDPASFFLTSPYESLDYTLVAVSDRAGDGATLGSFGWNRLIRETGKAAKGEYLNIIQHPEGRPKQLALRDNLLVDILDYYLHYETDTLRGSSGSPVFNDDWEVVALHHSGVPNMRDGRILKIDGSFANENTPDSEIQWIANEGVRVSQILGDIETRIDLPKSALRLRDELLDPRGKSPVEQLVSAPLLSGALAGSSSGSSAFTSNGAQSTATFHLPVHVAVTIGAPVNVDSASEPGSAGPPRGPGSGASSTSTDLLGGVPRQGGIEVEEVARPISAYVDRAGYDRRFLGAHADNAIPLPALGERESDAATISGAPPESPYELRYTHFSVVVSKKRRLPMLTAVNIDGRNLRRIPRATDTWYFDPRLDRRFQVGNELYRNNPLDRGHMVRRLDPVWSPGAEVANDDTFHYTNACPQHADLNQRSWNDLEDYILGKADALDFKVSVFTGPVLRDDDREYRTVRVPQEFWKVVAFINESTSRLCATGYLLSQASMIVDLPEALAFGAFRTYQVRVSSIEQKTGLSFGALSGGDPLERPEVVEAARGRDERRLIKGPGDLILA